MQFPPIHSPFLCLILAGSLQAAIESDKLKSFKSRIARPTTSLSWLNDTTTILLTNFGKDPEAASALTAYMDARSKVIQALGEQCNQHADEWASTLSDLKIEPDHLLSHTFEKALKRIKPPKDRENVFSGIRGCLQTGLSLESAGEGMYQFRSNFDFENMLRSELGIAVDPVMVFLAKESTNLIDDMGLAMSWERLRERLIRWELFIEKLGPKAKNYSALGEINLMKDIYLGKIHLANTPTVLGNGKANKEWLASLKKFSTENRGSRFIAEVDALVKKHGKKF